MKIFYLLILMLLLVSCGDNTETNQVGCLTDTDCPGGVCDLSTKKCVSYSCSPSENHCIDSKQLEKCSDDRKSMEIIECDFQCFNGYCVESKVCTTGQKECISDNEYVECSATEAGWDKKSCPENRYCLNKECVPRVCEPFFKECVDSYTLNACNANGTVMMEIKCQNGEECFLGSCVESTCVPRTKKCAEDGSVLVCKEDATGWEVGESCQNGTNCFEGSCLNIICETGEKICLEGNNRYYQECNDSRTGWSNTKSCDRGEVCNNGSCIDILCRAGEKKCDENGKIIQCNLDSLGWSIVEECSEGDVCKLGSCVEGNTVCNANERFCVEENSTYFVQCDPWGTGWLNPTSCGAGKICNSNECLDIVCSPNESSCVAGDLTQKKYKMCNDNGTAYLSEGFCNTDEICLDGECRTINCNPGERLCNNGQLVICENDGSGWREPLDCEEGKACESGNCLDIICTPNQDRCVDGTNQQIESCNESGTAWINKRVCGTGRLCQNNACEDIICLPGQKRCLIGQNSFEICNENGSGFENITACEEGETCISGNCMECYPGANICEGDLIKICNDLGQWETPIACENGGICENRECKPIICEPNQITCSTENTQYRVSCNSKGTGWLTPISCGGGKTCRDGECESIICVPNSVECIQTDPTMKSYMSCNEWGTSYNNPANCQDDNVCLGNACRSISCTPGEKVCDGTGVKECNDLGEWDTTTSCGSGNSCENGSCVPIICVSNEFRCSTDNNQYREQCNSTGTAWINKAPCGTGKVCNVGVCENIICSPGTKRCSDSNHYETCNSLGTGYQTSIACGSTQYCDSGVCIDELCSPNEKVCVNSSSIKVCNEIGSGFSNPQNCSDGMVCADNLCRNTICQAGETRCDGALIQTCSTDGTSWMSGVACPSGKTCSGNICIDYVCATNEKECVGTSMYKVCNSTRTGFDSPQVCGTNRICSGAGVCSDRVCAPGQTRCVSTDPTFKTYQICNASGSAWETTASCSDDLICDVDTNICKSVICNPGDLRCLNENGSIQSQTCNSTGTGWETPVTCGGSNPICTEDGCDNVICNAYEEIQCTGNGDSEYRRCNLNGTDWLTTTESCPDDYICKTGACVPVICNPNSIVCSSDYGYRTCNSDGTVLSEETTCENSPASGTPKKCYSGSCQTECEMAAINKSYMGCEYYAVDLQNANGEYRHRGVNSPYYYAIIISNPSIRNVSVNITDSLGYNETRVIAPNAIEIFEMDTVVSTGSYSSGGSTYYTWNDTHQLVGTGFGDDYSYKIESTLPIITYQFSPLGGSLNFSNDASLILPITAYGNEYRFLSWEYWNYPGTGTGPSVMTIVAKEDNTNVSVNIKSPTASGGGIPQLAIGETHSQVLNAGEILQFVNTSGDMSGSLINADKPIGVYGGHDCTFIPYNQWACDHVEEQLFPTNTWGNNYLVVKTNPRGTEKDYYKIVANENNTIINFTPAVTTSPITLNAGDVYSFNTISDFQISSTKPIMVGQFMASQNDGAGTGDPAFILQVPVEQYRKDYLFLVPNTYTYDYVTIVAPKKTDGTVVDVRLDGTLLNNSQFTNIGTSNYKRARISLTDGTHSIVADEPVGISVYGYDQYVSYGYPGGLNLKDVK